jgi:hypothetical protein
MGNCPDGSIKKCLPLQKNAMLYYPIGKQEFSVIRQHDFVYVDKTPWASTAPRVM